MRKYLLVGLFVFSSAASTALAQSGWFVKTAGINADFNYSLVFPSSDTGYFFGEDPKNNPFFATTVNGGNEWNFTVPFSYFPHAPYFIDANTGYFADGNLYILKTRNGGSSWEKFEVDTLNLFIQGLQFVSEKYGFLYGGDSSQVGQVFSTKDSGKTWNRIFINGAGYISEVIFKDTLTGYAVLIEHEPNIYRQVFSTRDGGLHWKTDQIGFPYAQELVRYLRSKDIWIGAVADNVLLTWKSDSSYFRIDTLFENHDSHNLEYIQNISFFSDTIGYIITNKGRIFKTIDFGSSWFLQMPPAGFSNGRTIVAASLVVAYAVGSGTSSFEVIKTLDGGGQAINSVKTLSKSSESLLKPIPASSYIDVSFAALPREEFLETFDAIGRRVSTAQIPANSTSYRLDARSFSAGVYSVRIGERVMRFIKCGP
jgi:photosystem II stability/assembly factor-like uncharacterized protein